MNQSDVNQTVFTLERPCRILQPGEMPTLATMPVFVERLPGRNFQLLMADGRPWRQGPLSLRQMNTIFGADGAAGHLNPHHVGPYALDALDMLDLARGERVHLYPNRLIQAATRVFCACVAENAYYEIEGWPECQELLDKYRFEGDRQNMRLKDNVSGLEILSLADNDTSSLALGNPEAWLNGLLDQARAKGLLQGLEHGEYEQWQQRAATPSMFCAEVPF